MTRQGGPRFPARGNSATARQDAAERQSQQSDSSRRWLRIVREMAEKAREGHSIVEDALDLAGKLTSADCAAVATVVALWVVEGAIAARDSDRLIRALDELRAHKDRYADQFAAPATVMVPLGEALRSPWASDDILANTRPAEVAGESTP